MNKGADTPDGAPELNWRKSRGLKTLRLRVGDINREIERRIAEKGQINILEVGCGFGRVLLELQRLYGERVRLYGINKDREHGDAEMMKTVATVHELFSEEEVRPLTLPELHYFDVCQPWPLPDNTFDVVFSHHSFLWFPDKIKALEEIYRVLAEGGIALLDLQIKRPGATRNDSIVIMDEAGETPCWNYFHAFENISIKYPGQTLLQRFWRWINRRLGRKVKIVERRPYLEMVKAKRLDFNLEFVASQAYSERGQDRKGCQSIYRRGGSSH